MIDDTSTPSVEQDLEKAWSESQAPEPDHVDQALATLRAARSILGDKSMMRAIRARMDESRDAVAQAERS